MRRVLGERRLTPWRLTDASTVVIPELWFPINATSANSTESSDSPTACTRKRQRAAQSHGPTCLICRLWDAVRGVATKHKHSARN
jgi:hypothetical protein